MYWSTNTGVMKKVASSGDDDDTFQYKIRLLDDCYARLSKITHQYYIYFGTKKFIFMWCLSWLMVAVWIFLWMKSTEVEKRREELGGMCDERARMLQDQYNVSLNHIQALAILVTTWHHGKNPSAIDQATFAKYTDRTAFERRLTSGVAYAVRVLKSEREQFEKEQGWTIKRMDALLTSPVQEGDQKLSPIEDEYAPVIFAQETIAHMVSLDMLTGKEDRDNVLRARASGKGVLTAPFRLLKSNRLGVILTFATYERELPSNATPEERIEATDGYLGGVFDIESLVERLLQTLSSKQAIFVDVFDTTNIKHPISMYGSNVTKDWMQHISPLHFGDPLRKHEMHCRYQEAQPYPLQAVMIPSGACLILCLIGCIFYAIVNYSSRIEESYQNSEELKQKAEAADNAKSEFLATVTHEIRTPMNGVLGMLQMLMDTGLDVTQQDYVRTAQTSGDALIRLINEVLDQARIESGKVELEYVMFNPRAVLDDVLSLFSGKSQNKGIELGVYISDRVSDCLIGDPGRFRQIVTNLMGNSIKFTEFGHIFLTVHLAEEVTSSEKRVPELVSKYTLSKYPVADRSISWQGFKTLSQEGQICPHHHSPVLTTLIVSVEDTGSGIPTESQSRVFTPFMQVGPALSRIHGGTGIGLSISKGLVSLMNGEIGFVSEPDVGSTFTFTAVLTDGRSNSNEVKQQTIEHPESVSSDFKGMKALVLDPRFVRAKVTRYHLQRLGIHAELASDLNQAFSCMTRELSVFDMFLVEYEIWEETSNLSDLLLKKLINRKPPKLLVLANSVITEKNTSAKASGYDPPPIIMKPLRASMLEANLQRAMGVNNKGSAHNGDLPLESLENLLRGKRILLVDDNIINLKVAGGSLKKYGAEVESADNGEKAIAMLRPPHSFDACFMDIQMPVMDGFETTRRIRSIERDVNDRIRHGQESMEAYGNISKWRVPILAMTAAVIQATHEECLKCDMDGYVSKPFDREQLYREVARFVKSTTPQTS